MKKFLLLCSISAFTLFFTQCASKKAATTASAPPMDARVAEVKRNFTPAQMEEGRVIWSEHCGKCHKLFDPGSRTIDKWDGILPTMTKKARLDDAQAGKVRAYLVTNAKMS